MRRAIPLLGCVGVWLALPAVGGAKEIVEKARACGDEGCRTEIRQPARDLPFELVGPTIQTGRRVPPPPRADAEPSFVVTLHTRPGRNLIRVRYLPGPGFVRARSERGRLFVPRRWVELNEEEASAYSRLTDGLVPFGASRSAVPVPLMALRGLAALI